MARPRLSDDERSDKRLGIPCTQGELDAYEWARLAAKKKSRAQWAKELIDAEVARLKKKSSK
jgi:hypothetical protein